MDNTGVVVLKWKNWNAKELGITSAELTQVAYTSHVYDLFLIQTLQIRKPQYFKARIQSTIFCYRS